MKKIRIFLVIAMAFAVSGINLTLSPAAQAAPPTLSEAFFVDYNHDGAIDRIKVVFDANVTGCKFEAGDWVLSDGSLTLAGPTWRLNGAGADNDCDGSTNYFYLQVSGASGQTGYPSIYIPAEIEYRNQGLLNSVFTVYGAAGDSPIIIAEDNASPVIMSSSPSVGATDVATSTPNLSITFSESMATGTVLVTLSGSGWGMAMWSSSDKVLTFSRTASFAYSTVYNVSVVGEDKNGYLLNSGTSPAIPSAWNFTTEADPSAVSASQSTVSVSPSSVTADGSSTSTVTVTVNNSSGTALSGKTVTLSSSRGATDTIVTMIGTTGSDGRAYFQVRSNTAGSSVFTATASGTTITQTTAVTFTAATPTPGPVSASRSSVSASPTSVVANDSDYSNIVVTVRDASDNFISGKTVMLLSNRTSDTVASLPGGSTTNSAGQATFQVRSSTAGTSTFTATADGITITQTANVVFTSTTTPPSGLTYGDLFKESGSTAVYYYGTDGKRHVFPTQVIYFSWYSNFSTVKTVSHSIVTSAPLGDNVISKPGTYLIQFVSMDTPFRVLDPKVYVLTETGQLRWVTSASAAAALYGADWERKIIPVPEVFRTNYIEGGVDVNSASDYNKASVEAAAGTINNTLR